MTKGRGARVRSSRTVTPGDCLFCKIISGELPSYKVYEDDRYVAFLDINPFSTGHTLVCPKKHGETLWEMDEREIGELFQVASRISRSVVSAMGADGFRVLQNNGEAANQVVPHVHVHIIPSMLEDKGRFSPRQKLPPEEMKRAADAISKELLA
jgi:histidine triad (HIT) family protein